MGGKISPPMLYHNSLPRRSNFQRNTPTRRSAAGIGAEPLVEYFVPRSMSDFDLSAAAADSPTVPNFLPFTMKASRKITANLAAKQKEKMVTFEDEMASRIGKTPDFHDILM